VGELDLLREAERKIEALDVGFQRTDDGGYATTHHGHNLSFPLRLDHFGGTVDCYAYLPTHVPERLRDEVMRALTFINYGLKDGNFEMDRADGEVRFKTYYCFKNGPPTLEALEHLVTGCIARMDTYAKVFMLILFADEDAEEALGSVAHYACDLDPSVARLFRPE